MTIEIVFAPAMIFLAGLYVREEFCLTFAVDVLKYGH
jgi:hypothetical protein